MPRTAQRPPPIEAISLDHRANASHRRGSRGSSTRSARNEKLVAARSARERADPLLLEGVEAPFRIRYAICQWSPLDPASPGIARSLTQPRLSGASDARRGRRSQKDVDQEPPSSRTGSPAARARIEWRPSVASTRSATRSRQRRCRSAGALAAHAAAAPRPARVEDELGAPSRSSRGRSAGTARGALDEEFEELVPGISATNLQRVGAWEKSPMVSSSSPMCARICGTSRCMVASGNRQ